MLEDLTLLIKKELSYRGSWFRRGPVGAFFVTARKWDRIEAIVQRDVNVPGVGFAGAYDILAHMEIGPQDEEGVLDQIRDLRCYLYLWEAKYRENHNRAPTRVSISMAEDVAGDTGANDRRAEVAINKPDPVRDSIFSEKLS